MIAHLVLFRPRADLPAVEAEALLASLREAIERIPSIRRARIGRRVLVGRDYEHMMSRDYPYAAVLEFDTIEGLRAYFAHEAHDAVGSAIFAGAADILIYDYDLTEGTDGITRLEAQT